jgi:hypothetical protein
MKELTATVSGQPSQSLGPSPVMSFADATRILACVNACRCLPTAYLQNRLAEGKYLIGEWRIDAATCLTKLPPLTDHQLQIAKAVRATFKERFGT